MIDEEDGGELDDLAEVYQPEPVHTLLPRKEFEAWHHPRKQYVRVRQWCAAVRDIIPELALGNGNPFRYLTLPGNELLDVRALHGVCAPAGIKLRYLGFNSVGLNTPAQAELALSQAEVRALASIDEFSEVLEDRLEAVANDRSPVSARAMHAGPFHAINLDLCDALTFREIGHAKGSPLEATGRLLNLQLRSATPWLLFITTKAEPALLAEFARNGFTLALKANAEASAEFRNRLADLVAKDMQQLDDTLAALWSTHDVPFLRLFCMGLGKWLLSMLAHAAPPRSMTLLSSCYYQSGPNGPDMLSLAFRCGAPHQVVNDAYAILPAAAEHQNLSEIESAMELLQSVGAMFDLDALLQRDAAMRARLIAQSGRLLAQARYNEEEYEAWAAAKFDLAPA